MYRFKVTKDSKPTLRGFIESDRITGLEANGFFMTRSTSWNKPGISFEMMKLIVWSKSGKTQTPLIKTIFPKAKWHVIFQWLDYQLNIKI